MAEYSFLEKIGSGSQGSVFLARKKNCPDLFAIKVIQKTSNKMLKETVVMEHILHSTVCPHPYIIDIKEMVELPRYYFLVMEFASGKTLLEYTMEKRGLSESEARPFFIQILMALDHIHKKGVIHRDLKLENVALDGEGNVKLLDFGFASNYSLNSHLVSSCGSIHYASPEIYTGSKYIGTEVDIWSFGVLAFTMVAKKFPFGGNADQIKASITKGKLKIPAIFSPEFANLITGILCVNPYSRFTLLNIKEHPWTRGITFDEILCSPPLGALKFLDSCASRTKEQDPKSTELNTALQSEAISGGIYDPQLTQFSKEPQYLNSMTLQSKIGLSDTHQNYASSSGSSEHNKAWKLFTFLKNRKKKSLCTPFPGSVI